MSELSHVDNKGRAQMVNVAGKPITRRIAKAEGFVECSPALVDAIAQNQVKKGNLLDVARIAGITGAKRTSDLIPLCHPLPLDHVEIIAALEPTGVRITATIETEGRTGVEMEAFSAVSIAALTVIDMGKAIDPAMVIREIRLLMKTGGKSDYHARTK